MKSIFVGHVTDQFIAIHFVVSEKFKTPEEMFDQRKELVTFITKCDGIISNYDNFNIYYFFIKIVPRASWLGKWEKEALGTRLLVHDNVLRGLLQIATGITEIAMNLLEQIATGAANCDSTSNPIATLLWLFQIACHATK